MKTLSILLLLSVCDPVLLSVQKDTLSISGPPLGPNEKYTDCWLTSENDVEFEVRQTSPVSWATSKFPESGMVTLVVCSEDGGCHLVEQDYQLEPRAPPLSQALAFALLAGLIMNFMPCVLPVIGLKLAAFADPSKRVAYIAGVMSSFMVLAALSLFAGTGLSLLGFGHYRMTLSVVCFLFGLSLFDVWRMPTFGVSGNLGPFGMGCLTVALGSSCSVPFLAPAVAFTMQCSPLEVYLIFGSLGVGFCGPFILPLSGLMSFFRHYVSLVEKVCGSALIITSVWLFCTLNQHIQLTSIILGFLILIILVILTKLNVEKQKNNPEFLTAVIFTPLTLLVLLVLLWFYKSEHSVNIETVKIPELYEPQVTFVTADWCFNCKPMKLLMKDKRIVQLMYELSIPYNILNYTDRPPEVTEFLDASYSKDVPVLRVVRIDGTVTVLSGLWTAQDVLDALDTTVPPNMPNMRTVPAEQ